MSLSKIIPNPFDKNSNLSGIAKKGELIKEGLNFTVVIRNFIFLIILAVVLVAYFKISTEIVAILIGTEILVNLIAGYIKIKEVKSIYSIVTQDDAKSYRKLLITNESWELIKSIFGVVANSISIALVFLFFYSEISNFVVQNIPTRLPIKTELLKYLIFVFVIFRAFELIINFVRYNSIKKIKESDDFAQVNQEYILIEKKLEIISAFPKIGIFFLLLITIGVPFWIPLIFIGFWLLMLIISVSEIRVIKSIDLKDNKIDPTIIQHKILTSKSEEILTTVFGILKTATGFKDIFKIQGYGTSWLGKGKYLFPENTLCVTNNRLLFLQIPVTGGNNIIGGTNYVQNNFFYNRGEIREKGENILKTSTMEQIISLATNDIFFTDIKTLVLRHLGKHEIPQIIIEKTNGDKLGYIFMDREYIEPLKQALSYYLKEKFILK